jgi:hypothetical protein
VTHVFAVLPWTSDFAKQLSLLAHEIDVLDDRIVFSCYLLTVVLRVPSFEG